MNSVQPSNTFIYRQLKTPLLPKKKINSRPKHQGKLCAQFDIFMHSCTCTNVSSSADGNKRVTGLFHFLHSLGNKSGWEKETPPDPRQWDCILYLHRNLNYYTHTRVGQKQKDISLDNQSCHHGGKYVQRNRAQWKIFFRFIIWRFKVQIFWEGRKILKKNVPLCFDVLR